MKDSDDETIFTHRHTPEHSPFAQNPEDYLLRDEIHGKRICGPCYQTQLGTHSITVMNTGIQLRAAFIRGTPTSGVCAIALDCYKSNQPLPFLLWLWKPSRQERRNNSHYMVLPGEDWHGTHKGTPHLVTDVEGILSKYLRDLRPDNDVKDPFEYHTITILWRKSANELLHAYHYGEGQPIPNRLRIRHDPPKKVETPYQPGSISSWLIGFPRGPQHQRTPRLLYQDDSR
jgi:hypothetical protein